MVDEEIVDAYLDRCEAESWEGRAIVNNARVFPFRRPVSELIAPLYALCGEDLDVMVSALTAWGSRQSALARPVGLVEANTGVDTSEGIGSLGEDVDRTLHAVAFASALYECIGNLFGRVPPQDSRYVREYVEAGHACGWNDGTYLGRRSRSKSRPWRRKSGWDGD